jgi:hypothetical protein
MQQWNANQVGPHTQNFLINCPFKDGFIWDPRVPPQGSFVKGNGYGYFFVIALSFLKFTPI